MILAKVIAEMNKPSNLIIEEQWVIEPEEAGRVGLERFLNQVEMFSKMTEKEANEFRLKEAIEEYHRYRNLVKSNRTDYFMIYDLCKRINDVAELSGGAFASASLTDKLITVTQLIKFVEPEIILQGVREYHESGWCK